MIVSAFSFGSSFFNFFLWVSFTRYSRLHSVGSISF
jgi:hypothetical protein